MVWRIYFYKFLILLTISISFGQNLSARPLSEDEKLIRVGTGAFNDRFYDIAERQFSQFIQDFPDHPRLFEIAYLLAKTFYHREKLKESRSVFLRILHENKHFEYTGYVLFWLANIELKLGNNEGARRYLISILNRYPKFEFLDHVHYFLGLIEFGWNRIVQAERHFKKVSSITKNTDLNHASIFWLGILSYKQNRLEEAADFLKTVTRDSKLSSDLYVTYGIFWLGETLLKQGRFNEAKSTYRTAVGRIKEEVFSQEVYWKLGFCDYRIGNFREAEEAFYSFKTQFKDSPLIPYVHYLLGEMHLQQNDPSSSVKELSAVLTHSRENSLWGITYLSLFWNHVQQNDLSGAHKVVQRLQKLNHFDDEKAILQWLNAEMAFLEGRIADSLPYYFNILNTRYRELALFRIGKGYFYENKFREAITNLDILFLEFPNSQYLEESLFLKGECLLLSGHPDQALEIFRLLIEKGGVTHWKLFAFTQLGNIYLMMKEIEEAERAFKRILDIFPQHPLSTLAAFQLGKLFFKQGNLLESMHYYSMILKGERPELLGGTYFSLGEIFYQQGKYDKALKSFEMALRYLQESSPWFFLTHLEIGNLQKKDGKYDAAKRSYQTILNQTKDEDLKKAAKDLLGLIETQ